MTTSLDSTLGIAKETTYGTAATVTRFFEGSETFDKKLDTVKGSGLRPNTRGTRLTRHVVDKTSVEGDTELDILTRGLGILFGAFFGAVTNTLVSPSTTVYQQVHTPSTSDPIDSFTIQKGVPPQGGGAVVPITMSGLMADTLDIGLKNTGIATAKIGWLGKDAVRSIGYAAPSYPADLGPYDNVHSVVTLGGTLTVPTTTALASVSSPISSTNLRDFSASLKNNLDTDGFNLGGAGKRTRKNWVGMFEGTGKVTADFTDTTLLDAYWNQTALPLVCTFTHDQLIDAPNSLASVLQLVFPAVRLGGETPQTGDGAPVTQSVDWELFEDGTNRPAYLVYRTLDTTP